MNSKILISLSVIGVVAALAIGGTIAYFSDTETSVGNTFTAGELDLKIDNKCTYNGATVVDCTWLDPKDLAAGDLFFNLIDVKPGDRGEDTVSLRVVNNNACGFVKITKQLDSDVSCTEPELGAEPGCLPGGDGELDENTIFTIWSDMGTSAGTNPECANVVPGDNKFSPNCGDVQLTTGPLHEIENWGIGKMTGNTTYYYGLSWTLPAAVGNVVQSDKFTADIEFRAEQFRNQYSDTDTYNKCPVGEIVRAESRAMVFGPMGWGGWSCPAGTHVIGGGHEPAALNVTAEGMAKPGSTVDGSTYAVFPHYTFSAGETGYVVQNINVGQTLTVYALCASNY